jgi:hypothetical protein
VHLHACTADMVAHGRTVNMVTLYSHMYERMALTNDRTLSFWRRHLTHACRVFDPGSRLRRCGIVDHRGNRKLLDSSNSPLRVTNLYGHSSWVWTYLDAQEAGARYFSNPAGSHLSCTHLCWQWLARDLLTCSPIANSTIAILPYCT